MNQILQSASEYINKIQTEKIPQGCVYHNLTHIEEVVEAAREIGENSGLTEKELELVLIAAWFHDAGLSKTYLMHEEASADIARGFLKNINYPEDDINIVVNNILATRMPHNPGNIMEMVLSDADLIHLGKKGYNAKSELLRAEWEKIQNVKFTDIEWIKNNIKFINNNNFHTDYAQLKYGERRKVNLEKLQKKLKIEMNGNNGSIVPVEAEKIKTPAKEKPGKDKRVDRGVETMFRNTIRTHVEFSSMADKKADIMISVNTLLLTAVIAVLARKLDNNPHLIIPTAIITLVSLVTLIYAILATRPQVTSGTFTTEDIEKKKVNLLFFGNFFNMQLKDFHWGMTEMMNDRDYLYGSMIKDIYYLGKVLGQKYKYLRICYNIFMYGLILSVIAFTIAVMTYPGPTVLGPILD
jgi:predicted metal-dependent HD superfamily phosphohydrolase